MDGTTVPIIVLCDPKGALLWTSQAESGFVEGAPLWDLASGADREQIKNQLSRVAFLRELQTIELKIDAGPHYYCWAWPVMSEGVGMCLAAIEIPRDVRQLSDRERKCMQLLSLGRTTGEIAAKFDVSLSTVQTYLRRTREKLGISTTEELIAFAARYLPPSPPAGSSLGNVKSSLNGDSLHSKGDDVPSDPQRDR